LSTKQIYTHKALRQLQLLIQHTNLSDTLWHILLQVFLAIGDTVLAAPYGSASTMLVSNRYDARVRLDTGEVGAVMSYRLVPSIFQVFIVAIAKHTIAPGLWRTFRDYAQTWRHRRAVIDSSLTRLLHRCIEQACLFRLGSTHLCINVDRREQTLLSGSARNQIHL
jgi:hypothetical protein